MADGEDEVEELEKSLFQFDKEEPSSDLILVAAQKCVGRGKWRQLVEVCTRAENKDAFEYIGWELISIISQSIVDGSDLDLVQECTTFLSTIAETCSAKEVCIGVLERLESPACYEKFAALLNTLRIAIERLKQKKSKFVGMALPCITRHIRHIHLPDDLSRVDCDEKGSIGALHAVLSHVLQFMSPLVQEVSNMQLSSFGMPCSSSINSDLQKEIIHCLIQLLDHPLVFLDTSKDLTEMEESEGKEEDELLRDKAAPVVSPYRQCAQDIMQYLCNCNCSFVYLMEYMEKNSQLYIEAETSKEEEDELPEREMFPILGLGCFVYLLLVENMEDAHFPAVFSYQYLLTVNMKSILGLLKRTEHCAIYKGLALLDTLLRRVKDNSLQFHQDLFSDALDIAKALINIMIMCSSKKLRIKGVEIFPDFFGKLDARGRYGLLYTILKDCNHSGAAGLLIYLLKEQINQALTSNTDEAWFQGSRVMSILQLVFKPPSGATTERDMVRDTDRIMAAVNCLRFILLRDEADKTTVWKNFASVEQDFVEPLKEASRVTRIQYQAELISKRDEMAGKKEKKGKEDVEMSISSPDGKVLGLMPLGDQCEALQSGLYSLDMIESVLARISEISHSRNKGRT